MMHRGLFPLQTDFLSVDKESVATDKEFIAVAKGSVTVATESVTVAKESVTVATESVTVATEFVTVAKGSVAVAKESVAADKKFFSAGEAPCCAEEGFLRAEKRMCTGAANRPRVAESADREGATGFPEAVKRRRVRTACEKAAGRRTTLQSRRPMVAKIM
jgi:hypothetical protein